MSKESKVGISIYISLKLLTNIQNNIQGKTQSEKVRKCIQTGYKKLVVK